MTFDSFFVFTIVNIVVLNVALILLTTFIIFDLNKIEDKFKKLDRKCKMYEDSISSVSIDTQINTAEIDYLYNKFASSKNKIEKKK